MPGHLPYWRLSGFYFFYFAFVGAFAPYWSLYLKSLAFSAFEIGVLMSLLQVMRVFAPNAWGWLADHTGKRLAIVQLGAVLGLVAYSGALFGTSFAWLFLVMGLMSFFWSASLPLVEAMTLTFLGESAASYGKIRLWGSIGFIVAVIGVGYLLDFIAIAGLLWVVLAFKAGIVIFSRQIPDPGTLSHPAGDVPVWEILRRPEVIAFFAACFLMAAAHGPYYTFFSIYLEDHGYAKGAIGWLWALGVICEIGVFFLMPRLMQRFSLKAILAVSFGCAVVRFLITGWAVDALSLMLIAQALHAASFGSYHAAAVAVVHRFFRGRHQAKGQALYTSLSFGAGGALGGFLSGVGWETLGAGMTFTFAALAALAGMGLVIGRLRIGSE
ncbi:MAG: MFS transporter [Betaproteobacteria bacterium]|nr:MFS transporter [Betaproteobacteria bacterium]